MHHQPQHPQGLYDPRNEHDACGVAFVATLTGVASHRIVDLGLAALRNLAHRGASGAEPESGDGAGMLVQVPDEFFRAVVDFDLPPAGATRLAWHSSPTTTSPRLPPSNALPS